MISSGTSFNLKISKGEKMTINELIKELNALREDIKNKDVVVIQHNGLQTKPDIKFELIDRFDPLNMSSGNIKRVVLT
jgi:hypothetical protein